MIRPRTRSRAARASFAFLIVLAGCTAHTPPKPVAGGIRIESGEPGSLDPVRAGDPDEIAIVRNMFRGLVTYDAVTAETKPAAATSWRVRSDAEQFTFVLRHDDRFSNGERVTADSFVRAFNRLASKAVGSPLAGVLSGVAGFDEFRAAKIDSLTGVVALDEFRLQITLTAPDADFVDKLGQPALSPIPSDNAMAAQRPSFAEHPIGNGPFQLDRWVHNESITLKPNPRYYGKKPALSEATFVVLDNLGDAYDQWKAGNLDWTPVPPEKAREAQLQNPSRLIKRATGTLLYLVAITDLSPTKNVALREAISLAIDRRSLATQLFAGTAQAATGVFPPSMPGYRDPGSGVGPCSFCTFDETHARDVLAAAHIKPTTTVRVAYAEGSGTDAWAQRITADVGRTLHLPTQLIPKKPLSDYRAFVAGAKGGLVGAETIAMRAPTPADFLDRMFVSGGEEALSRWNSGAFNGLASQAKSETDDTAREILYRHAEDAILGSLPIIPLWFAGELRLVNLTRFSKLTMDTFGYPTIDTAIPTSQATS